MVGTAAHRWQFRARFRRHAFGWRSQPAIQRIKEAVSEIERVARKDTGVTAEDAMLFLWAPVDEKTRDRIRSLSAGDFVVQALGRHIGVS